MDRPWTGRGVDDSQYIDIFRANLKILLKRSFPLCTRALTTQHDITILYITYIHYSRVLFNFEIGG